MHTVCPRVTTFENIVSVVVVKTRWRGSIGARSGDLLPWRILMTALRKRLQQRPLRRSRPIVAGVAALALPPALAFGYSTTLAAADSVDRHRLRGKVSGEAVSAAGRQSLRKEVRELGHPINRNCMALDPDLC